MNGGRQMVDPDLFLNGVQMTGEGRECGAGKETSDDQELVIIKDAKQSWRCIMADGGPGLHGVAAERRGIDKRGRENSYDRVGLCVEPDGLAHDGGIAAIAQLPERIREDDSGSGARAIVVRCE